MNCHNELRLSKHFLRKEFECKCGCGLFIHNEELLSTLENIRYALNLPIIITSGTRCKTHNARIGGKTNSDHCFGRAVDFYVKSMNIKELAKFVQRYYLNLKIIPYYERNFIHVAVR